MLSSVCPRRLSSRAILRRRSLQIGSLILLLCMGALPLGAQDRLQLEAGDRVIIAGNTFAERMQLYGYFETALQIQYKGQGIVVRNLGWSGDEVDLMPRPQNFGSFEDHLGWQQADVVLLCYGMNESFAGDVGLDPWRQRLDKFVTSLKSKTFGKKPVRLVLVSPIAHEDLGAPLPTGPQVVERNRLLGLYSQVMAQVAKKNSLLFLDLHSAGIRYTLSQTKRRPLTINGIHLNEWGDYAYSRKMAAECGWCPTPDFGEPLVDRPGPSTLRRQVFEKNHHFFLSYRPLNPFYIWGGRAYCWRKDDPMMELERIVQMVEEKERALWVQFSQFQGDPWSSTPGAEEIWETPVDYGMPADIRKGTPPQTPTIRRNGATK